MKRIPPRVRRLVYNKFDGRFAICDHTIKKNEFEYGRTYRHYMIDGNVYKSRKKILEVFEKI